MLPSASHVLTFNRTTLPVKVRADIHRLSVRALIPQPMLYFQCLRFRHTASKCVRVKTCFCGKLAHGEDPCAKPMECVNCGSQNSSRFCNCPVYKQEVANQEIRTLKKLICPANQGRISFAQAVTSTASPAPILSQFLKHYFSEAV